MAKRVLKVPPMGESISEVTIATILKASGSSVKENEELLEFESDKVNQLLYAPMEGVVEWNVREGDSVLVGGEIGAIVQSSEKEGEKIYAKEVTSTSEKKAFSPPVEATSLVKPRETKEEYLQKIDSTPSSTELPTKVIQESATKSRPPQENEKRSRLTTMRKAIADRLVRSKLETAMLTTFNEVDMSTLMELRHRYQEEFQKRHQVKLGIMSFFVKAAQKAMERQPKINSYIDGDELVQRLCYHIGVAVSTEKGLVVPVLRHTERLDFASIEKKIEEYAKKARSSTLQLEDLQGGGFTITNGGIFGSLFSTPIINPPQSAILGMHAIQKRAVVVADQIVIRPMMYLALSYDHRIIDGREAVTFLQMIKQLIEAPNRLLFDL